MTAIEVIPLIREVLFEAGFDVETGDVIDKRALSAPGYVFVEEFPGTTPHIDLAYRPTIQTVVYSSLGVSEAVRISHLIQSELREARTKSYTAGGIHRVITTISPHRQDLPGLPPGVGRAIAQYDLILSTKEKWS